MYSVLFFYPILNQHSGQSNLIFIYFLDGGINRMEPLQERWCYAIDIYIFIIPQSLNNQDCYTSRVCFWFVFLQYFTLKNRYIKYFLKFLSYLFIKYICHSLDIMLVYPTNIFTPKNSAVANRSSQTIFYLKYFLLSEVNLPHLSVSCSPPAVLFLTH